MEYGPDYELEVHPGNRKNHNTVQYLRQVYGCVMSRYLIPYCLWYWDCIRDVMVGMLASRAVDRGFEPQPGKSTDYEIGICCFFSKHTALRSKNKDWLDQNRDIVSECSDMSIHKLISVS